MNQERWSGAKRNQIGERIEFAPEGAFNSTHPRYPPIKQVEDACQQNEAQANFDLVKKSTRRKIGFDNFGQCHKTAEEVSGSKQVGQEIDFQPAIAIVGAR